MTVLDRCIIFATEKHPGQLYTGRGDFEDEPYILHPLRVMLRMATNEERQAAVLHDVLEDTETTAEGLQATTGVLGDVLEALDLLRRDKAMPYANYILRIDCSPSPLARAVKVADLLENLSRFPMPGLRQRYERALEVLQDDGS